MSSTMPCPRLSVPALLAFAALALAPAVASAGLQVDSYHGSHCHASHFNGETEDWVYEGTSFVNRGGSAWDILVASCPVHVAPPVASARIMEIRVVVDGATYTNGWCNLTDELGTERPLTSRSTDPEWFWFVPPTTSWGRVHRDLTFECLLLKDWKLEAVEVVWIW